MLFLQWEMVTGKQETFLAGSKMSPEAQVLGMKNSSFRGYIQESTWCVLSGEIGSFVGTVLHMRLLSFFVVFQETGSHL